MTLEPYEYQKNILEQLEKDRLNGITKTTLFNRIRKIEQERN